MTHGLDDVCRISLGESGAYEVRSCYAGMVSSIESNNPSFSFFLSVIDRAKVFFDVGAHAGLYTLPACRMMPEGGAVHAFEANSSTYDDLVKHLAWNGFRSCVTSRVFVGDSCGERVFYENLDAPDRSTSVPQGVKGRVTPVTVEETSLDSYCADRGVIPDLVKIDVEGAEIAALKGADRLLREHRPLLILSFHPGLVLHSGGNISEVHEICARHSYTIRGTDGVPVTKMQFGDYLLTPD